MPSGCYQPQVFPMIFQNVFGSILQPALTEAATSYRSLSAVTAVQETIEPMCSCQSYSVVLLYIPVPY